MSTDESPSSEAPPSPRWRPLEATQRRVLGVLIEKAKTTPENYPMSLNALRAGCNQKSNRAPLMQLEESQIEEALDGLRQVGALAVVQGSSRVDRYRHLAYDWLGVTKVELAVVAELLLRGVQTVGDLRGRASRMEPIKDLSELTPTLDALQSKGLLQYLTPPGRGGVVTHALYLEREMDKVRREAGVLHQSVPTGAQQFHAAHISKPETVSTAESIDGDAAQDLVAQLNTLRDELAGVRRDFESARDEFTATADALRRDLDQLNRQLGN